MTKKTTKRALLLSALSMLICVSMLIGTTFAWFTDSVTSSGNIIKSGTLDIVMEYWDGDSWEDAEGEVIPFVAADGRSEILWEPGCTYEMAPFRIRNEGNLSAKLLVLLNGVKGDEKLMEVIELKTRVDNIPESVLNGSAANQLQQFEGAEIDVLYGMPEGNVLFDWSLAGKGETTSGTGHTDTSPEFTVFGHMAEEAGNEYQGLSIEGVSITVIATQQMYESDSFDKYYDKNSKYPNLVTSFLPENRTEPTSIEAGDVTVEIPADAPAGDYKLTVDNTSVVVDEDGNSVANFEIDLTRNGQSVNSDGKEYIITIFVAKGLNPDTTKLYHKGVDITSSIVSANPADGTVTFKTDSFSPFAVEYNVDCDIFVEQDQQTKINTIYVFTANGFEQLNKMMIDKTAGKYAVVKLCANIDMTDKIWTPVDSHADTAFYLSEFDGQGFTISNLTINGQAMFTRFAGFGDVTVKDVTFYNANVNSNAINTSILTVQSYQNVLLDNVDVTNSSITGGYKVAPLIATVYNEAATTVTATLKNCDVSDTTVKATTYDFCTTGMVAFVHASDNDKVEFENCTVSGVKLIAPNDSYKAHAWVYTTGSDTLFNEAEGVTVSGCSFESLD